VSPKLGERWPDALHRIYRASWLTTHLPYHVVQLAQSHNRSIYGFAAEWGSSMRDGVSQITNILTLQAQPVVEGVHPIPIAKQVAQQAARNPLSLDSLVTSKQVKKTLYNLTRYSWPQLSLAFGKRQGNAALSGQRWNDDQQLFQILQVNPWAEPSSCDELKLFLEFGTQNE
jgi:hypothetical protein